MVDDDREACVDGDATIDLAGRYRDGDKWILMKGWRDRGEGWVDGTGWPEVEIVSEVQR